MLNSYGANSGCNGGNYYSKLEIDITHLHQTAPTRFYEDHTDEFEFVTDVTGYIDFNYTRDHLRLKEAIKHELLHSLQFSEVKSDILDRPYRDDITKFWDRKWLKEATAVGFTKNYDPSTGNSNFEVSNTLYTSLGDYASAAHRYHQGIHFVNSGYKKTRYGLEENCSLWGNHIKSNPNNSLKGLDAYFAELHGSVEGSGMLSDYLDTLAIITFAKSSTNIDNLDEFVHEAYPLDRSQSKQLARKGKALRLNGAKFIDFDLSEGTGSDEFVDPIRLGIEIKYPKRADGISSVKAKVYDYADRELSEKLGFTGWQEAGSGTVGYSRAEVRLSEPKSVIGFAHNRVLESQGLADGPSEASTIDIEVNTFPIVDLTGIIDPTVGTNTGDAEIMIISPRNLSFPSGEELEQPVIPVVGGKYEAKGIELRDISRRIIVGYVCKDTNVEPTETAVGTTRKFHRILTPRFDIEDGELVLAPRIAFECRKDVDEKEIAPISSDGFKWQENGVGNAGQSGDFYFDSKEEVCTILENNIIESLSDEEAFVRRYKRPKPTVLKGSGDCHIIHNSPEFPENFWDPSAKQFCSYPDGLTDGYYPHLQNPCSMHCPLDKPNYRGVGDPNTDDFKCVLIE